jgi:outer membrane protein OmpA-like peptidoglycan-associated protein
MTRRIKVLALFGVAIVLGQIAPSFAQSGASQDRQGWRLSPRIQGGYSGKSVPVGGTDIAKRGSHLGADLGVLYYKPNWVFQLSGGLLKTSLSGTVLNQELSLKETDFLGDLGFRLRSSGWQIGPSLQLLAGTDVSFIENTLDNAKKTAFLAAIHLDREVTLGSVDARIGAYYKTDLNIANRQVNWLGVQLALELPFQSESDDANKFVATRQQAQEVLPVEPAPAASPSPTPSATPVALAPMVAPEMKVVPPASVRLNLDESTLQFDTNKSDLKEKGIRLIDHIARFLVERESNWKEIRVEGHADWRGPSVKNQDLSYDRAQAVALELHQQGIASQRIVVKGFGASRPLYRGKDVEKLRRNRRVEVYIDGVQDPEALLKELQESF